MQVRGEQLGQLSLFLRHSSLPCVLNCGWTITSLKPKATFWRFYFVVFVSMGAIVFCSFSVFYKYKKMSNSLYKCSLLFCINHHICYDVLKILFHMWTYTWNCTEFILCCCYAQLFRADYLRLGNLSASLSLKETDVSPLSSHCLLSLFMQGWDLVSLPHLYWHALFCM